MRFILFLLFFSCAGQITPSYIETVPVLNSDAKFIPDIQADQLREDLGPTPPEDAIYNAPVKKDPIPVVAIILGPGINRVFGHISLLRSLKESDIPLHYISGTGLAAVIAAMYAANMTPDRIEWFFYKFFGQAKKYPPYSTKWHNTLKKALEELFEKKMIEDLNLSLVIPRYDKTSGQVVNLSRGGLVSALLDNLQLQKSSALEHQIFSRVEMGTDLIFGIDVLGEKIFFDSKQDFLYNIFKDISDRIRNEKENLDMFFELPIREMPLDSLDELPLYLQQCSEESGSIIQSIKEKIKMWQRGSR